jgi:hypothetical protein
LGLKLCGMTAVAERLRRGVWVLRRARDEASAIAADKHFERLGVELVEF